jgi:hypothetical protein
MALPWYVVCTCWVPLEQLTLNSVLLSIRVSSYSRLASEPKSTSPSVPQGILYSGILVGLGCRVSAQRRSASTGLAHLAPEESRASNAPHSTLFVCWTHMEDSTHDKWVQVRKARRWFVRLLSPFAVGCRSIPQGSSQWPSFALHARNTESKLLYGWAPKCSYMAGICVM